MQLVRAKKTNPCGFAVSHSAYAGSWRSKIPSAGSVMIELSFADRGTQPSSCQARVVVPAQSCSTPSTRDPSRGPLDHIGGMPRGRVFLGGTGAVPVAERPPRGDTAAALDPR